MLEVIIDLVPFGIESKRRKLLTIKIANAGESEAYHLLDGSYLYSYKVETVDENDNKTDHGILVKDFDRAQPAYILVGKVIDALKYKGVI